MRKVIQDWLNAQHLQNLFHLRILLSNQRGQQNEIPTRLISRADLCLFDGLTGRERSYQ